MKYIFVKMFFFLCLTSCYGPRNVCEFTNEVIKSEVDGIILDAYVDSTHHLTRTLVYKQKNDTISSELFVIDHSEIFFSLKKGDRIKKKFGTLDMIIVSDGVIKNHRLDYGCEVIKRKIN